ncbi:MAG: transposase [Chloroflexi bacterium]|nr:transposase [Chloroflexota bacterium]
MEMEWEYNGGMDTNTTPSSSAASRVYFRQTTASQRRFLFEKAEETGNIAEAARRAHVGRGTYYYWRPRYGAGGAAALDQKRSCAPHRTRIPPVNEALRQEVLDYHRAHPEEGYRSMANGINKIHGWQKVISHTKVGEIVREAEVVGEPVKLPSAPVEPEVAASPALVVSPQAPAVVHASQPNKTLNIDLCVVPLTHESTQVLESVSLSQAAAGAMPTKDETAPAVVEWPGQVFGDTSLSYEQQMAEYAQKRTAKRASKGQRKHRRRQKQAERAELRARSDELRLRRRRQRQARRLEDAAWRAAREARRAEEQQWRALSQAERRQQRAARQAQQQAWQQQKAARRVFQQARQAEDQAWRQERQRIRSTLAVLTNNAPLVTAWLAILVIVDNGTRRCIGLPLFTAGVQVTAEMVVAALRAIWPEGVQFVISDNGAQFIAEAFQQFTQEMAFLHVRIAPRRPRTNGIAERFVRTLKEWLEKRPWHTPEELFALLTEFIEYYNDRPHQGAELDGLSPNEYTRRLSINCSTC